MDLQTIRDTVQLINNNKGNASKQAGQYAWKAAQYPERVEFFDRMVYGALLSLREAGAEFNEGEALVEVLRLNSTVVGTDNRSRLDLQK